MISFITFSKPAKDIQEVLGKPYQKAKIKLISATNSATNSVTSEKSEYMAEFFTEKQAFQQKMSLQEVKAFFEKHAGTTFKNVVCRTESQEITVMANRHGEIKRLSRKLKQDLTVTAAHLGPQAAASSMAGNTSANQAAPSATPAATSASAAAAFTGHNAASPSQAATFPSKSAISINKKKNYIMQEGTPVPFLIHLGVMTKEGKVVAQKYDKFRQINRFLEFIKDIVPELQKICTQQNRPLRIADFGCGKSYLTFAVYYYLNQLLHMPVEITGLDLKEDVIHNCQALAHDLGWEGLHFQVGDVAGFSNKNPPDLMITLHACDTATDYALEYAVKSNATAILSVPCCQHEINTQLQKQPLSQKSPLASLTNWGILQERLSALATDAIRAEVLEQSGYSVQLLEFIDFEGTPKNLLIRAVKKNKTSPSEKSAARLKALLSELNCQQKLVELLINK